MGFFLFWWLQKLLYLWLTRPKFYVKLYSLMIKLIILGLRIFVALVGLWSYSKLRLHIVATLLRLEFATLSIYFILFSLINFTSRELYMNLIYLTLAACEGALGLSILVVVIKFHGNDYLNISNIGQC
jgi:NADH-ubiquinone oxidoreductase chain 4L